MYIEADVSKTMADTIKRSGINLQTDGSGMKISVPNAPSVPKRKVKVAFLDNPSDTLDDAIYKSSKCCSE